MEVRYSPDTVRFERMTTQEVRSNFLVESIFTEDRIDLVYCDADRAILGSAVPKNKSLTLGSADELRAEYFAQRREIGILNIGGAGSVSVDGKKFDLINRDCLYVSRGSKEIVFESVQPEKPAMFYLLSYPAHQSYPIALVRKGDAAPVKLGGASEANCRTIYKYIHPGGIQSCQLVMGVTELESGSVWNTMPVHTHPRRTEVYMYFDIEVPGRVFHLMGKPDETRHIVVSDRQAIISPAWSIHSGVGTRSYSFCWGMGGENQAFDDMDSVAMKDLR